MRHTIARWALIATALISSITAAAAQPVLFDLDSGTPPLSTGMSVPFTQTVSGITATFSSPSSGAFYLGSHDTTFWTLRQFSGIYLIPNTNWTSRNHLVVTFSAPLTSIAITFATVEYQDNAETPNLVQLTAKLGTTVVGTATSRGAYLGDTFPMGTVSFVSPGPTFDSVDLFVLLNANGTTDFLADNVLVETTASVTSGMIPDGSLMIAEGIGGALDLHWLPSCLAADGDYAVYEGTIGDFTSHVARVCTTSGSLSTTLVPSAVSDYYLVVPHGAAVEGSYGTDSALAQRPTAITACFPQAVGACP